jgi:hypothetical protein
MSASAHVLALQVNQEWTFEQTRCLVVKVFIERLIHIIRVLLFPPPLATLIYTPLYNAYSKERTLCCPRFLQSNLMLLTSHVRTCSKLLNSGKRWAIPCIFFILSGILNNRKYISLNQVYEYEALPTPSAKIMFVFDSTVPNDGAKACVMFCFSFLKKLFPFDGLDDDKVLIQVEMFYYVLRSVQLGVGRSKGRLQSANPLALLQRTISVHKRQPYSCP